MVSGRGMRRKKIAPFFLIVADRDKRVFTVEGPMVDDTEWNEAVGRAQKEGRRVTCCGAGSDRSRAEKDYAAASRFQLAPSGSIVDAPLP
jgi:hypothetical protein